MSILKKQFIRQLRRYREDRDGATAVEFGILLIPFSAMIFAIIELGIIFFIQATMGHAMQEAARDVRTGQFQSSGGLGDAFQQKVCEGMSGLGDCGSLRVDVVSSSTGRFVPSMLPATPTSDPSDPDSPPPMPGNNYVDTGPRAVVVVRVQYYHDLAFPGAYTRLANASGNVRILETVTAFRNEPFP
jgi:Flp pilus assembly pilin Flp